MDLLCLGPPIRLSVPGYADCSKQLKKLCCMCMDVV